MYMEFRDLAVIEKDRELININRIRIYYNLKELLSGKVINSLKEIRIVKSIFFFDYNKDKDLISLFENLNNAGNELNIPDIIVSGKNLKIKYKSDNNIIELTKLFFTFKHRDKVTQISTKGFLRTNISYSETLSGSTKFSLTGTIKDNYDVLNTLIVFNSIENNFIVSDKISLRASYKSGEFNLQKVEDSRPLDIRLSYSILDKLLKINFASEEFIPLDYFKPKNIPPSILQWLSTSISGHGELQYSTNIKNILYSAEITAKTNNSAIPEQAIIDSSFSGDNSSIIFSNLEIDTIDGHLVFGGIINYNNFLPSGNLQIIYDHPLSKIKADLTLEQKNNNLEIKGNKILIDDIEIFYFKTSISIFDKDLDFKTSLSLENLLNTNQNQIIFDGNIQYKPDFFLNLSISTVNTPINSILSSLPVKSDRYLSYLPLIYLNTDLFISTDLNQFSFSSSKIQFISNKNDEISFTAFGNNESIDISNFFLKWDNNIIKGSSKTELFKRSVQSSVNIIYEENTYNADFSYYPERGLFFQGMHGLSGSWYKSGNISEFNLSLVDFPIPLNDTITSISLDTSGYYNNINNWKANINLVDILNLPGLIPGNNLNFTGEISNNNINLSTINYYDSISSLIGSGYIEHSLFSFKNSSGNFYLDSIDGEQYNGDITVMDNNINFTSDFIKAPLDRFNKIPVIGIINGKVSIKGSMPKPDISMTLQLEKGEYDSSPLEVETSFELNEDNFLLSYLRLKYKNQILQKGYGEYNQKSGIFNMNLEYLGIVQNKNIKTLIEIKGESELLTERPSINEILQSNYISYFSFDHILINNKESDSWDFEINSTNQNISFNGGPKNSLEGYIDNSGSFKITSKMGLPVRGVAEGKIENSLIDMKISNMEVDLTLLNLIPYGSFLEFTNGTGFGELSITGQLNDPLFYGSIHVINAKGNVFMVPEDIKSFSGDILVNERTVSVGPEILEVNGSFVKVGIDLNINKWIPDAFSLNIKTINEDRIPIIYDVTSIGLGIDGFVTGEIIINQDEYGTHINSDLVAEECIINLGTTRTDVESSENGIFVNMLFTTGRKVQFIWPSNTLPILRATAEQDQTIKLNMDTLNATYSLKGVVNIKYGGIYYFQKSFYLSDGSIVFDENETKFDPFLGFTAQIKEVNTEGEIINISLIQDKKPVSQFAPRFESDPPLSDVEIFSILGAGVFAELGTEQIDLTSALLLTGDLVTQFAIIRNFEKKVKNIFNLDLFSIRTQMIQNILIDRFIQNDSVEQDIYLDSFGRYLDNTSLYLGKYLGDDIFLQALVQINNQQFIDTDLYATNKLLVESTISLEWQTPLFLLGFSVKPDFVDPVSSIQNTSLELSWGYSY